MAPNKNAGKAAAKAAKKAKQAEKAAKKEAQAIKASGKSQSKGKGKAAVLEDEEEDLDAILERYQAEMRAVTALSVITLETPPPPRVNALLLASPSTLTSEPASNHLYMLFGEFFDGSRVTFYNSVLRYDIAKNEWREYKSGEGPAPRSSAAGVAAPNLGDGGGILIFGGEYASPTQTSFHHYKDLWLFSIKTHLWEKIETKKGPSGRSGHRMVVWKHYVILFGGFIDVGIKTNYLSDLWIFDMNELKWKQIEYLDKDRAPGPRSGFSFIPCPEGAILHGGFVKEYVKGVRSKGVPREDTWMLRMDLDLGKLKWERRKRVGYAPSLRSGCSMTHWASKGMGVLFGGVLDEEKDEDDFESIFYNDMFAYNPAANGRWVSLNLKRKKKAGGRRKKKIVEVQPSVNEDDDDDEDGKNGDEDGEDGEHGEGDDVDVDMDEHAPGPTLPTKVSDPVPGALNNEEDEDDADDPAKTVPLTRYNAMLAIVKNTLFIYGGIYETSNPAREYTLDDFVTLNLEKLDRFNHIRGTGLEELEAEWKGSDDEAMGSDSDDEESESEDEGEEGDEMDGVEDEEDDEDAKARRHAALSQAEKEALRQSATKYMGVAKDENRPLEDVLSTPLPGENLRVFYDRSREYWAGTAYEKSGSRGKTLRREGFELANPKYEAYKPILEEIERIQKEAEVDKADAMVGKRGGGGGAGEGRNRR